MHICYVADARSPIAKNWISHFVGTRHKVTVISSYPCAPDEIPAAQIIQFPVAFSSFTGLAPNAVRHRQSSLWRNALAGVRTGSLLNASTHARAWLAPLSIRHRAKALARLLHQLQPDLVHAMRLPYEGFLAAAAATSGPLVISVWGNDFTLFAERHAALGELANEAMRRADGLHCDCRRDLDIAISRGFSPEKPWRVLPGNGGLNTEHYFTVKRDHRLLRNFGIPEGVPLVVNPRGLRSYVRNDTFFRAIPPVMKEVPNVCFLATGMSGNVAAERWTKSLRIEAAVRLLPTITREQLAGLFATSQIMVSPSSHDGTPNTLLEAVACGCFPVVGEVASLHEWIEDGKNGLFCDESNPNSLAKCIVRAIKDPDLRVDAAEINRNLVCAHAERSKVMAEAETLYREVVAAYRALSLARNQSISPLIHSLR